MVLCALAVVSALDAGCSRRSEDGAAADRDPGGARGSSAGSSPAAAQDSALSDFDLRNQQIALYQKRLLADPENGIDLAQLAGLYMQRARETGDKSDYARAEEMARRSLAVQKWHNGKSSMTLASSLVAQHRFAEARDVARQLDADYPGVVPYEALLAELEMEMGDYDAARALFDSLAADRAELSVAPRLARWLEISGEPDSALAILSAARDEAARRSDVPREQVAWFHLRVGDLLARCGRLDEADAVYRAGLEVREDDSRLLAAMARAAALRNDWRAAIYFGQRAAAKLADPPTLVLLGDAYDALGDSAQAAAYYAPIEAAALGGPEPFNRVGLAHLLDHDRRVSDALEQLRKEIAIRKDIQGYDLLAWALHKSGDDRAAREAMTAARRLGTRDPLVLFHAAMIERALGDRAAARRALTEALAINPRFHARYAAVARAALDSLGALGAPERSAPAN